MMKRNPNNTPQLFDKRAEIFEHSDWVLDTRLLSKITSLIDHHNPSSLLDLGIGTGIVEKHLKSSPKITGVDISPQMLRVCKNNLPNANLIVGDIRHLAGLVCKKFDVIFSRAALGHTKILPVLKSANDLLSKHGKIILCENISYSLNDIELQIKFHNLIHPGHIEFPTRNQFISMFKKIGLKVLYQEVLYTNCSLNSLLASLETDIMKRSRIKRFLLNLEKSRVKEWKIECRRKDIFYRKPWILLAAGE